MLKDASIDIATVAQTPIVFNSFNNEPYVIVATMAYSLDDIKVLARRDRGVVKGEDLKGKTIGATKGRVRQTVTSGGNETILVVEDDAQVRQITTLLLTQLGYKVLESVNGSSAMKMLEKNSEDIDLVFTDMVMPAGISGVELADFLKINYPNIKILMTSGYPDRREIVVKGLAVIQKPYKKAELAEAIQIALAQ